MFRFGDPGGRMYLTAGTSQANIVAHWTTYNGGALTILSNGGRFTGTCIQVPFSPGNFGGLTKQLDSQSTWGIAFALKISGLSGGIAPIAVLSDSGTIQTCLIVNANNTLSVCRGSTSTVLATSTFTLPTNVWVHVEWKTTLNNTAGSYEVRINGSAKIGPTTNANTISTANSTANQIGVTGGTGSVNFNFDDIIIYDGQATDAAGNPDIHDFIGDCSLTWLMPNGAGTYTNFTADSGSNYARVNEATPDGNTSYVEASTVGTKDSYLLTDLAGTVTNVKSVALCHYAERTDVGAKQLGAMIRTNSTDYIHPTGIDLNNGYAYSFRNWGSNPKTSTAWTASDINALEIGQVVNT